ncbi:MAG: hypothetical protein B7Z22_14130, partial [Hyphomonas sp. 32-62-5]
MGNASSSAASGTRLPTKPTPTATPLSALRSTRPSPARTRPPQRLCWPAPKPLAAPSKTTAARSPHASIPAGTCSKPSRAAARA